MKMENLATLGAIGILAYLVLKNQGGDQKAGEGGFMVMSIPQSTDNLSESFMGLMSDMISGMQGLQAQSPVFVLGGGDQKASDSTGMMEVISGLLSSEGGIGYDKSWIENLFNEQGKQNQSILDAITNLFKGAGIGGGGDGTNKGDTGLIPDTGYFWNWWNQNIGGGGGSKVPSFWETAGTGINRTIQNAVPGFLRDVILNPQPAWYSEVYKNIREEAESRFAKAGMTEVRTPADVQKFLAANQMPEQHYQLPIATVDKEIARKLLEVKAKGTQYASTGGYQFIGGHLVQV